MLLGPDCGWRGQFLPAPPVRPCSVHACQIEGGATSTVQHSREEGSVPALFRVSIPGDDAFVRSIHVQSAAEVVLLQMVQLRTQQVSVSHCETVLSAAVHGGGPLPTHVRCE